MAKFTKEFEVRCVHCKSGDVIKKGMRNGYQRYLCKKCDRKFDDGEKPFGKWNRADHIAAAVDMYYSGMSYKQIAEILGRNFGIPEPSKSTIFRWVREYSDMISEGSSGLTHKKTFDHWVADEMQLKVGGKRMWNWNVMDRDTRYLLASYLSPHRGEKEARAVFEKALKYNGGAMPDTITTDGLGSYGAAISLIFPHTQHIISEGIHEKINNNLSERVQGTFRDRTKTLRGLQGQRSGQKYLDGWVADYNFFRDHEAHKGGTPGAAAGVGRGLKDWSDVVDAVATFKAAGLDDRSRNRKLRKTISYGDPKPINPKPVGGRGKTAPKW